MTSGELPALGFGLPISGPWATPEVIRSIAREAERRGYATLWTFQRLLDPVQRPLGPAHRSVLDPIAALGYAAAQTERIRVATGTICAPFTPPAVLAKALTTLDVLSEGRLTVGLGMGWLAEEYAAAGVPYARRGARLDEYLRCLLALWTEDPVQFDGEFYVVPRAHTAPRPVQRPHPPLLLGGTAEPALRRAGRLANGWIAGSQHDLAQIAGAIATVREGARAAGRDPDALQIVVRGVVELRDPSAGLEPDRNTGAGSPRRPLAGTRDQVLADLVALRARGVTEVMLDLNLSPRVTGPEVAADAALAYAEQVLDAFAPDG